MLRDILKGQSIDERRIDVILDVTNDVREAKQQARDHKQEGWKERIFAETIGGLDGVELL
jgi:hypothetical protein